VETHRQHERCDHERPEEIAYPPVLHGEPEFIAAGREPTAQRLRDQRAGESREQCRRREPEHVRQAREGDGATDTQVHEPRAQHRRSEFDGEQQAREAERNLRREYRMREQLRDVGEHEQREEVARWIEKQEREERPARGPEHRDPLGSDQRGEADTDRDEMHGKINGRRRERT
jgi:hypothetical protein